MLGLFTGCNCGKTAAPPVMEITAADVAWATDIKICKWDLTSLTSNPVYWVGVLVLGPKNEVLTEGPWIGDPDGITPIDPSLSELCLAFRRTDDGVDLKFRVGGIGGSSHLTNDFTSYSWYGGSVVMVSNLLIVADNGIGGAFDVLHSDATKICLKISTEPNVPTHQ